MEVNNSQCIVGIDIGTTAIRCVIGEVSPDSSQPSIIGFSEVENTGMRKGNVAHADEVADAIIRAVNEAERMSGRQVRSATINVNGAHVQGFNSKGVIAISPSNREIITDDRLRVEEAATIVQLPPNKEIIQVFAKNYRLDGQDNIKDPVGMQGVRLEVDTHIVLASAPAFKSLNAVLEKAEVAVAHHTIAGLAAAEAVLDRKQKDSGTLVLDLGATTTNMLVIEDGEIEHVAVVPMGSLHVTNDLAIGLKTDLDIAEQVKLKHAALNGSINGEISVLNGGKQHRFERELIQLIVSSRMEELFEYVDKELKKIHKSRKLPGGVVMVGGGAKMPGLVDFAKEQLQLPARLGSWKHVSRIVDGLDEQLHATAVGLMLLDLLLGPSSVDEEVEPGILQDLKVSLKKLIKKRIKN